MVTWLDGKSARDGTPKAGATDSFFFSLNEESEQPPFRLRPLVHHPRLVLFHTPSNSARTWGSGSGRVALETMMVNTSRALRVAGYYGSRTSRLCQTRIITGVSSSSSM